MAVALTDDCHFIIEAAMFEKIPRTISAQTHRPHFPTITFVELCRTYLRTEADLIDQPTPSSKEGTQVHLKRSQTANSRNSLAGKEVGAEEAAPESSRSVRLSTTRFFAMDGL